MKKTIIFIVLLFLMISLMSVSFAVARELTAEEIMQKVDQNQYLDSARIEARLIIKDRGREMVKEMISLIVSDDLETKALTEFTNPEDRGTKYLMLGDDLWMYFPAAEDLVRISGHMMRQGMMGSDFSYEDILESEKLIKLYDFQLIETTTINEREVYVLKAVAQEGKEVTYHQRKLWVDSKRFIVLREELYSTGGRLLKLMETKDVINYNERYFPVEIIMNDKLRQASQTIYQIKEIDFNYEIPADKISLDALQ